MEPFSEEMSDQRIKITQYNIASYYVFYCKQNKIKVNESKIDTYIERIQQLLIPETKLGEFEEFNIYSGCQVW